MEQETSYDILNALNLINEDLGKAYEEKGYNPLGEGFNLDEDYAYNTIDKNKYKKTVLVEPFLENGNRAVSANFKFALANTTALKLDILTEMENADPELKQKLSDVLFYLNNREELLIQAIEKLKDMAENSFKLYEAIYNLDSNYGEMLKESFFKEFNKQIVIENFLRSCKAKIRLEKFRKEQIEEQERLARQKLNIYEKKLDKELEKMKDDENQKMFSSDKDKTQDNLVQTKKISKKSLISKDVEKEI